MLTSESLADTLVNSRRDESTAARNFANPFAHAHIGALYAQLSFSVEIGDSLLPTIDRLI